MANNRMYIRHISSGKEILLCKFYPSTRWYMFHSEEEMNKFFHDTTEWAVFNRNADDLFGPTDYELIFEHEEEENEQKGKTNHG